MNTVAIVVPIYKKELSEFDKISLNRCFDVLGNYPVIVVKPKSLEITDITKTYSFTDVRSFDDDFFADIHGYNRLMTSDTFYETFLDYKYILIHQLDAFVFRNNLKYWCSKGYDYIGAPWLWDIGYESRFQELKFKIEQLYNIYINKRHPDSHLPIDEQFRDMVGNGGFSLRNVAKFYEITREQKKLIMFYNANTHHHFFNEDIFWTIEMNRKKRKLKIPSYRIAAKFSMENGLHRAWKLTKGQLPFACHDWDNNLDFWRPHFKSLGYIV